MKYAENLVVMNIAKYPGLRSGTEGKIPRPCLVCGIGVRSEIQLCRGCGRETEGQRLNRLNILLQL